MRSPLAIVLASLLLAGCTSVSETFPGHDRGEVWEALVAVARGPSYDFADPSDRWSVRRNDVWVDEAGERIELDRWLVRDRSGPDVRPRREERHYRLRILLEPIDDPPTATLTGLGAGLPAHVWEEADRYFATVRSELRVAGDRRLTEASGSGQVAPALDR